VACGNCGAVLDATDPDHQLIAQYEAHRVAPPIPLGTRGQLAGETYEVIGYLERRVVNEVYTWSEYLLHNPLHGQRWLTEYHGHWMLTRAASGVPKLKAKLARYQDVDYRHFQTAKAELVAVVGEFPWTPRVGDTTVVEDYIAPPRMLSAERTQQEVTWSTAEYVDGDVVWKAFGRPGRPPARLGVGAAQPSPYAGAGRTMLLLLASFIALAVLIQLLFAIFAQQRLVSDIDGEYRPGAPDTAMVISEPFSVSGRTSNVMVEISTNVANTWAYFTLTLVNEDTGVAKTFGREVGLYSGRDSDGAWSEGASWDRTYLPAVASGSYVLLVEPEGPYAVHWRVRLTRDVPRPLWLWLSVTALFVPPVIFLVLRGTFENRRWSESDYGGGDDD
jgi:hypothetical protein